MSRSPQTTLSTPGGRNSAAQLGQQQRRGGRGVGGLQHDRVAGRERRRDLPDGHHRAGSSTASPGRRRRSARAGRRTCGRPCIRPADLPSSIRAAPAKKRIWSTAGGISSLVVSAIGLPVLLALDLDELLGPRLDGVGDPEQCALPLRRRGVAPRLERGRGGTHGRVDIGGCRRPERWRTSRRWSDRSDRRSRRRSARRYPPLMKLRRLLISVSRTSLSGHFSRLSRETSSVRHLGNRIRRRQGVRPTVSVPRRSGLG